MTDYKKLKNKFDTVLDREIEILEGNKLIAEFMDEPKHIPNGNFINKLEYHSSWDWLIPIIEKIEAMGHTVFISDNACRIMNTSIWRQDQGKSKIEVVYLSIIDFIHWNNTKNNWHNKQTK